MFLKYNKNSVFFTDKKGKPGIFLGFFLNLQDSGKLLGYFLYDA
jgi:hypothetical protein